MAGKRPDYVVDSVVRAGTRTRRREIGVAFWNERKDTLSVLLDAIPLSGRLVLAARTSGDLKLSGERA